MTMGEHVVHPPHGLELDSQPPPYGSQLHQRYWLRTAGHVLSALLEDARYPQQRRAEFLQQFGTLVAPFLGPPPPSNSSSAGQGGAGSGDGGCWQSFMTDDHTPIELSWDFHTGADSPTIRYSMEPVAPDAGTPANPRNEGAAAAFKEALLRALPGTDTTWHDYFEAYFGKGRPAGAACKPCSRPLTQLGRARSDVDRDADSGFFGSGSEPDEVEVGGDSDSESASESASQSQSKADGQPPSTSFWAFDLLPDRPSTVKAYYFPGVLARATGRTNFQVISDAIASAPGCRSGNHLEAFKAFARFVQRGDAGASSAYPPAPRFEMDMLAVDLVPIDRSRIKIYLRDRRTDFASAREVMSVGGQLLHDSDFEKGMLRLRRLWDALFGTDGVPDHVPLPHKDHRTAGILYNVEFRVDRASAVPKVKIYMPVRHYAQSDRQVVEALSRYMAEEVGAQPGLHEAAANAKSYAECIHRTL